MDSHLGKLKAHGLKLTSRRRAVIALFAAAGRRLAPADVHRSLRRTLPSLGLPTVYRILEELEDAGVLIRLRDDDRRLHYALCRSAARHHHHFVCRVCQRVEEVEYCAFPEVAAHLQAALGASCHSLSMQIEGTCAACRRMKREAP